MKKKIFLIFPVLLLIGSGCTSNQQIVLDQIHKQEDIQNQVQETEKKDEIKKEIVINVKPVNEENVEEDLFYDVVRVIDGDTVKIKFNDKEENIRLIGIDTPETVHPSKPVQCFGVEASNIAKKILEGKQIKIEFDETQGQRDKYKRLLGYIFLADGTNFNKKMIKDGYAYEYTYNSSYKYQTEFKEAQKYAQENKLGLWADGVCEEEEISTTQENQSADNTPITDNTTDEPIIIIEEKTNQNNTNCECSSNIYNCSDFKTHNEAQTIYECCGGVNSDIHKLDKDKDGSACETLP